MCHWQLACQCPGRRGGSTGGQALWHSSYQATLLFVPQGRTQIASDFQSVDGSHGLKPEASLADPCGVKNAEVTDPTWVRAADWGTSKELELPPPLGVNPRAMKGAPLGLGG